jgi:hypothetical protein
MDEEKLRQLKIYPKLVMAKREKPITKKDEVESIEDSVDR